MAMNKEATLNRFDMQPTAQREWNILILVAFFFGAVGTGLFLVSAFYGFTFGVILSLLIIVLLMGIPHMLFLGHPLRFWKVFVSGTAIKTAWITRGLWSWGVFMVFGTLYIAPSLDWFTWLPWTTGGVAGTAMGILAAMAAVFGMMYPGFAMSQAKGIAFWNTPILPALFLIYGLIDGIDLTLISVAALGETYAINIELLEQLELLLLILGAIFIWAYVGVMSNSSVASKEAVRSLVKGEFSFIFWIIVITLGLLLPVGVALYGYLVDIPMGVSGVIGLLALVGALYFKYIVLKAGVYSTPI